MSDPARRPSAGQLPPERTAEARAPAPRATSRRATPRRATSSSPPRARAASASRPTSIRCPAATARCWRWTSPATGRRDAEVAARRQQRLPRRRGLLRLGRAGRAARATPAWHEAAHDAGVAVLYVHGLNPYGFSWWRRTTHENVDLNRNFRDFAAPTRRATTRYDEIAALLVPATWPADAATVAATRPLRRRARRARAAAGDLGRPVPPSGRPLLRRQRADLEPRDAAPGAAPARQRAASRLAWIDLHTGLGPSGHGERIFACRDDAAAYARAKAWWGDVTSIYDGSSTSALLTGMMWLAAYEECAAGRVHRHRARVRHPAASRGDARAARRPVAREPSRGRRRDPARDQAAAARRLLHRHRRVEGADRRAGRRRRVRRGARPGRRRA